jgi:hypothetical protein
MVLWFAARTVLAQASGNLSGVVLSTSEGRGVAHAVIALPSLGIERFTNVTGAFHLSGLPDGNVRIQVRRLGYAPLELTVAVVADSTVTIEIPLERIAISLSSIRVTAMPPCKDPGPPDPHSDSTFATLFSQVALNARQYRLLAERYPFTYVMVARHVYGDSTTFVAAGDPDTMRIAALTDWRYAPGRIAAPQYSRARGRHIFVHLLTLVDLADQAFIENHCFHHAGIVATEAFTAYRIDFAPASRIRTPDFSGEIYIDTTSYQVRRTIFRLEPLAGMRGLTSMSVTTDFVEVMPGIPIVANVVSEQTFDTRRRGIRYPRAVESQWLVEVKFLGRRPDDPVGDSPRR